MKKVFGVFFLVIIGLGLAYFGFRGGVEYPSSITSKDLVIREIAKNNETDYSVRYAVHFNKKGLGNRAVTEVEGVLTAFSRSKGELVTEWKSLALVKNDGQESSNEILQSIVGKQSVSLISEDGIIHNLAKDFPDAFLRTEVMILDRLLVRVPVLSNMVLSKDELDDQVPFLAEYSFAKEDGLNVVRKKWLSYKDEQSGVDPDINTITYLFDSNQHLLAAKGLVKSYFRQGGESELLIDFSAKSIETRPASDRMKSLDTKALANVDRARIEASDTQNRSTLSSFPEVMKEVESITDRTDGGKYYEIFRNLTDQVRAHPEYSSDIAASILSIKGRDPSSRRKLSAMVGALAESRHSEGIDALTGLAKDCSDNVCKVQAIMGVNTHSKPSLSNGDAMLDIARTSSDKEVAATAVIAAGAVGRKLEGDSGDISRELIRTFNDPSKDDLKTSTLAAMGNHGSPEYFPILSKGVNSDDSSVRSASVYSLRYIPGESANSSILNVIATDKVSNVVSEALKASGFRKFTADEYGQIATSAADFKNKELAEQAASLLLEATRSNPGAAQGALMSLKEKTKFADVKTYIDQQLKSDEAAHKAN